VNKVVLRPVFFSPSISVSFASSRPITTQSIHHPRLYSDVKFRTKETEVPITYSGSHRSTLCTQDNALLSNSDNTLYIPVNGEQLRQLPYMRLPFVRLLESKGY
jgi:hypothetical protein